MRLPLEIASTVRRFVLEEAVATRCPSAICNKVDAGSLDDVAPPGFPGTLSMFSRVVTQRRSAPYGQTEIITAAFQKLWSTEAGVV